MIGTVRNAAQRTLILTGLLLAAVSFASAGEMMIQGAKIEGSRVYVAVANPSAESASATVAVVVQVNGSSVVRSESVVLAAGQSTMVCMDAGQKIDAVTDVGLIEDTPTPF